MNNTKQASGKYLIYQGKPLVRENNIICYGNMTDRYILCLMILTNKVVNGVELPERIIIQVLSTDEKKLPNERIVKQGEKNGLFDAFDIGLVWLERALNS